MDMRGQPEQALEVGRAVGGEALRYEGWRHAAGGKGHIFWQAAEAGCASTYCDEPEPIAVRADPPWCRGKMELERKASQGALGLPIDVSAIS